MNKKRYANDNADVRQRFSIRKLSIGTASVLLGTFFYLGATEVTAQAANINNGETEIQTLSDSSILKNEDNEENKNTENFSQSNKQGQSVEKGNNVDNNVNKAQGEVTTVVENKKVESTKNKVDTQKIKYVESYFNQYCTI